MASYYLPKAGTEFAPCEGGCEHRDCELTRRNIAHKCRVCNKPMGFGARVYLSQTAQYMQSANRKEHSMSDQKLSERDKALGLRHNEAGGLAFRVSLLGQLSKPSSSKVVVLKGQYNFLYPGQRATENVNVKPKVRPNGKYNALGGLVCPLSTLGGYGETISINPEGPYALSDYELRYGKRNAWARWAKRHIERKRYLKRRGRSKA